MQSREAADVAVVGGGTAGALAAVAAGRAGAKTVLVEQYGFVGGVATTGMAFPGVFDGSGRRAAGGLVQEFFDRVNAFGADIRHVRNPAGATVTANDPELTKFVLMDMLLEANVRPILHSFTVDAICDGSQVSGILIANKSGLQIQPAKVFVDATGDADVVARAGGAVERGRPSDGLMQPITLIFRMSNVDFTEIWEYLKNNPEELEIPFINSRSDKMETAAYPADYYEKNPGAQLETFSKLLKDKWPDWDGKDHFHISTLPGSDHVTINVTRVRGLDATNVDDLSEASWRLQRQASGMVTWLRANAPGFRNARLLSVPFQVGVRETRRIKGLYSMTTNDVLNAAEFDDGIGRGAYPLDIHDPAKNIDVMGNAVSGHGISIIQIVDSYAISYRALVPETLTNVLAAGRCISAEHEAAGSLRGQAVCMVTGEAAGVAAALAARADVPCRDVSIPDLRSVLEGNGVVLDRAKAERLTGAL